MIVLNKESIDSCSNPKGNIFLEEIQKKILVVGGGSIPMWL